ncbi:unnamed protein product (macronuclear) [Paramecium tetraurelia]|uniref:Transmembrane protein n=1 Tax=Paramecium tetraurelia TaxID=5888 RepID=A0BW34_PARTE|nr:uncharacterized protein GSPATT00032603001 [Paramecium tetraurelia]CAK62751.1 unnamed protein product [Paramecium tetraurelia]|eukprot:XP_001430149.1 hypothetical protein (macronuclear) [Paramecium tetraurelia strain d4-2]
MKKFDPQILNLLQLYKLFSIDLILLSKLISQMVRIINNSRLLIMELFLNWIQFLEILSKINYQQKYQLKLKLDETSQLQKLGINSKISKLIMFANYLFLFYLGTFFQLIVNKNEVLINFQKQAQSIFIVVVLKSGQIL